MANTTTFKGWAVDVKLLESLVNLCKKYDQDVLKFGVAGMVREEVAEFIDPEAPTPYDYSEYKLFMRGVTFNMDGFVLATLPSPITIDDFPPIPPEPMEP